LALVFEVGDREVGRGLCYDALQIVLLLLMHLHYTTAAVRNTIVIVASNMCFDAVSLGVNS